MESGLRLMAEEIKDNIEEKPKSNKLETCEDWQEFFGKLANPKCTKCYGRGYTGWSEFDDKGRMPIGCSAKNCSIHKLRMFQREQQIRQMKKKQEEMKEKKEEKNDVTSDTTEPAN
jgi:hypothetical protein